jgi:non-ribosomal peptide synthetase component F
MIQADLRHTLTRDDAQLALHLVAPDSARDRDAAEDALQHDGIDALLDDARLLEALTADTRAARASLPMFVYVVVRHSLRELGESERAVADYVASVVVHFADHDRAWRVAVHDDATYDTLAALLADAAQGDAQRSFLVRQHLANYALWLSGLFPDKVSMTQWRRGGPDLSYYDEMGRQGFRLAAEHRMADSTGLRPLFARAAGEFPLLRMALNRVSDRLLFPGQHSPERLMRQVADETRWRLAS